MQYLDIFNLEYVQKTPKTGIITSRDIDYIKRLYTFNKDSIVKYYQDRNFAVKNTNIISRILEHFPVYLSYDVYRYLEFVDNKLTYLAKHFKFTSDIEKGTLHPPYFFGNNGYDIILSGSEYFNAIQYSKDWKDESCITILKHPRNDNRFLLPLGKNDGNKSGLSSIYIDVPKLAIKYREFVREQIANIDEDKIALNKNNFVIKYVLNTCMDSVIDHTLLNKVMDRFYGIDTIEPDMKHRFKIYEPNTQVNRYVDDVLTYITSKDLDFVNLLRHIKLVFKEDASELLVLPEIYGSRQIQPAILGSRIDYMLFMLDVCKNKDKNKHYINDWKRYATRLENDSNISTFYDGELEKELKEKLYILKNI